MVKAVLRGKFVVLNIYVRKEDLKSITLSFRLRKLEKEEQIKSEDSRKIGKNSSRSQRN